MNKMKLVNYVLFSSLFIGCGGGSSTLANIAPIAIDKTITLNENRKKKVVLEASDAEGNTLTYKVVKAPSHGTFKNGIYIPTAGYVGTDSFTFIVNNGTVDSEPATITIMITADFDGDDISDVMDTDDDNDGVLDINDVFPLDVTESVDTDGDGIGNNADRDDDNDGVLDINDVFPLDVTESVDTDGDGIGNNADRDDDNDGVLDINDVFPLDVTESVDTDGDGIGNNADTDDDGDGISDLDEIANGSNPLVSEFVTISGKIEYERVHATHNSSSSGLDYNNITTETAKQIIVKVIDSMGNTIATTSTDDNGNYSFVQLPKETLLKIRVYAKLLKSSRWDVKVIDNTNENAQYVLEGALVNTGTSNSIRNLKATANDKKSPPFAILDSIYLSMKKVLGADDSIVFPPLNMNWTVNNVESGTYFDGNDNIMIQGDQNGDSDEYDNHVIIHEWGHYFEAKFSRADSIGGQHGYGDSLDIRLAFGEGWGNAWSAIATDDPIYFDTFQSSGWNMNIETASKNNPGWFSEASVQRILYDLYDSNDDGFDTLSLGFKPLYNVFVGAQKTTPAFTTIFSFIKALKDENVDEQGAIDSIVGSESIATITDIWGTGRSNRVSSYPYHDLEVGGSVNITINTNDGLFNKLGNHQYVKFNIATAGNYAIRVNQTNGTNSDPDFVWYKTSPFRWLNKSDGVPNSGVEETSTYFEDGKYILDIIDASNVSKAEYSVTITPQ